jgi:hypothetical protein
MALSRQTLKLKREQHRSCLALLFSYAELSYFEYSSITLLGFTYSPNGL